MIQNAKKPESGILASLVGITPKEKLPTSA